MADSIVIIEGYQEHLYEPKDTGSPTITHTLEKDPGADTHTHVAHSMILNDVPISSLS